jgi:hypothetical protein
MAGKSNKNKAKAKPVVNGSEVQTNQVDGTGKHGESIADKNVSVSTESSEAESSSVTVEKVKEEEEEKEEAREASCTTTGNKLEQKISENDAAVELMPDNKLSNGGTTIEGLSDGNVLVHYIMFSQLWRFL